MNIKKLLSGCARGKPVVYLFFTYFAFSQVSHAVYNPNQQQSDNTTNQIIIKYKKNTTAANRKKTNAKISVKLKHIRRMHTGAYVMQLPQAKTLREISAILSPLNADPNIEYAEPDLVLKPSAITNDPRLTEQWNLFNVVPGNNISWDVTQGAGTVVAVIDTGYRPHTDLVSNILPGYDMITDTTMSQDGNGRDPDATDPGDWAPAGVCKTGSPATNSSWHGTHVAGIIAAVGNNNIGIAGIAYGARIVPVRVLGRCGGYTSDISDGIIWAAGGTVNGIPVNRNPANVINLSLGGPGSCGYTQQNAINIARNLDSTVVVSAGNNGIDASNTSPANCAGVITVGATDRLNNQAHYSNYGSVLDISAPGGDIRTGLQNGILSTLNSGTRSPASDNYEYYQGTSMAAPLVSGTAALLYSAKPLITPDEVERTLSITSMPLADGCTVCGAGMLNFNYAVYSLDTVQQLKRGWYKYDLAGQAGSERRYTYYNGHRPRLFGAARFYLQNITGNADLYVKFGAPPTTTDYDCLSNLSSGSDEYCRTSLKRGTYHIMVRGVTSYRDAMLRAR